MQSLKPRSARADTYTSECSQHILIIEAQVSDSLHCTTSPVIETWVRCPIQLVGGGKYHERHPCIPARRCGQQVIHSVVETTVVMYIDCLTIFIHVTKRSAIKCGVNWITQCFTFSFKSIISKQPIWFLHVGFCSCTWYVRKCFIHATRLSIIDQIWIVFSEAMSHFMSYNIQNDERVEPGTPITECCKSPIPKRIIHHISNMNGNDYFEY